MLTYVEPLSIGIMKVRKEIVRWKYEIKAKEKQE